MLDDVNCLGSESQLISCSYDSHTADCSHAEDAGVRCQTGDTHYHSAFQYAYMLFVVHAACIHGSVRLRGGSYSYEGRVEVCVNGVWGSVCDDYWGVLDAKVACRKVGYPIQSELNLDSYIVWCKQT